MARLLSRIGITVAAAALLSSTAVAAPGKGKKAASAPKCSACKMTLSTKKDKMHTVAVKVGGKTYYCCSQCPMNAHKAGGKKKS